MGGACHRRCRAACPTLHVFHGAAPGDDDHIVMAVPDDGGYIVMAVPGNGGHIVMAVPGDGGYIVMAVPGNGAYTVMVVPGDGEQGAVGQHRRARLVQLPSRTAITI